MKWRKEAGQWIRCRAGWDGDCRRKHLWKGCGLWQGQVEEERKGMAEIAVPSGEGDWMDSVVERHEVGTRSHSGTHHSQRCG